MASGSDSTVPSGVRVEANYLCQVKQHNAAALAQILYDRNLKQT